MTKNEIVQKNLQLHNEWMRYCFIHPEILTRIPKGAQIIILPNNMPELAKENKKTAEQLKRKSLPLVIIHLNLPKPPTPRIEVISAYS